MQQSTSSLAARAFILSSLIGGELTGERTALELAAVTPCRSERARLAADAQHLGDRPGLERAAGGGVRRGAVGRLGDRAEPPLAEVRLEPVEHAVDRDAGARGRRRRTGRSATARRCPGGRRRRAPPARRGGAAGSADRRARASAGRAASAARARQTSTAARAASPRQRRSGQRDGEQLVRPHATRRRRPGRRRRRAARRRPARTKRATNDARAVRASQRSAIGRGRAARDVERADPERVHLDRLAGARRDRHAVDARVHPRQRPAVGALPQQPVGRVDADAEARAVDVVLRRSAPATGASSPPRSSSPVTATWRPSAWTNQSVPSTVLYSSEPGVGGVREHPLGDASPPTCAAPRAPRRRGPVAR